MCGQIISAVTAQVRWLNHDGRFEADDWQASPNLLVVVNARGGGPSANWWSGSWTHTFWVMASSIFGAMSRYVISTMIGPLGAPHRADRAPAMDTSLCDTLCPHTVLEKDLIEQVERELTG